MGQRAMEPWQVLHGQPGKQVAKADILETPSLVNGPNTGIFTRTLNVGKSPQDLESRIWFRPISPGDVHVPLSLGPVSGTAGVRCPER